VPAVYETVKRTVVDRPAQLVKTPVPAEYRMVKVQKVKTPARAERRVIPAEYGTVTRQVARGASRMEWRRILCETNVTPEVIADVQTSLNARGFNVGAVDGSYGKSTAKAVADFQAANNLPQGGLTYETLKSLGVSLRRSPRRARTPVASRPGRGDRRFFRRASGLIGRQFGDRPPRAGGVAEGGGPIPGGDVGPEAAVGAEETFAHPEGVVSARGAKLAPLDTVGPAVDGSRFDRVAKRAQTIRGGVEFARGLLESAEDDRAAVGRGEGGDAAGKIAGEAFLARAEGERYPVFGDEVGGPGVRAARRGL